MRRNLLVGPPVHIVARRATYTQVKRFRFARLNANESLGFGSLVIILVIVLVVSVIGELWYYEATQTSTTQSSANQTIPQQRSTAQGSATSTVTSKDGASSTSLSADEETYVYSNTTYGVSFTYPASKNFVSGEDTSGGDDLVLAGGSGTLP